MFPTDTLQQKIEITDFKPFLAAGNTSVVIILASAVCGVDLWPAACAGVVRWRGGGQCPGEPVWRSNTHCERDGVREQLSTGGGWAAHAGGDDGEHRRSGSDVLLQHLYRRDSR